MEGADGALVVADPDIRACRVEGHAQHAARDFLKAVLDECVFA